MRTGESTATSSRWRIPLVGVLFPGGRRQRWRRGVDGQTDVRIRFGPRAEAFEPIGDVTRPCPLDSSPGLKPAPSRRTSIDRAFGAVN